MLSHETILKLAEMLKTKSPYYTITFDGRIAAIANDPISKEDAKRLNIGRFDAYDNSDFVFIPKDVANKIMDIFQGDECLYNRLDNDERDALEYLNDAANQVQYQAMCNWIEEFLKTTPRNPDGSFKID